MENGKLAYAYGLLNYSFSYFVTSKVVELLVLLC